MPDRSIEMFHLRADFVQSKWAFLRLEKYAVQQPIAIPEGKSS
jgi:hypothetical protein